MNHVAFPYKLNILLQTLEKLRAAKNFVLIKDVANLSTDLPEHVVTLRFDVERNPAHATIIAHKIAKIGIIGTFYVHSRKDCYDLKLLTEIQDLGHEIGLHHECLDRCHGNFDKAKELFLREVEHFRKDGLSIQTVCGHGEAGLPKFGYHTNCDLIEYFPDLLSTAGIKAEVYNHVIQQLKPIYASDTFRSYARFFPMIKSANNQPHFLHILVHPHRWHHVKLKTALEVMIDLKQHSLNRILRRRTYSPVV